MTVQEFSQKLTDEIGKVFIGKQDRLQLITAAVLAGGHVLLDDLPGSGKTTLVKALSLALGCSFRRIQFTPDLLPTDIIGMTVFDQSVGEFRHQKGPVFTNILLADEINRAIPRTQSALLEAMEEKQVTIDNETFPLPRPFTVLATQNPVEQESTFKLPAAQMDRFFLRLSLGFPDREEESLMLRQLGAETDFSVIQPLTDPDGISALQAEADAVFVSDHVREYIIDLVHRTREHPLMAAGASPRATRSLFQGGKVYAALQGRSFAVPEDIQTLFLPVIAHRVLLTAEARYTGKTAEQILSAILAETPVPPENETMFHEAAGK